MIYVTGRNESAASEVLASIKDAGSSGSFLQCDHADLASVRRAAETLLSRATRLDVLVANAGVMALPPGLTQDGYERHFGINHVAHALLIRKLLPLLQRTRQEHDETPRILSVSSLAILLAPRGYGIVFDDLKTTQDYWILGKWQRYAQSKLANLLYGQELAVRYPDILTLVVDPGPSHTGLVTSLGLADRMIVYLGNYGRFLADDQGHWNLVWATGVSLEHAHQGGFYEPVGVVSQDPAYLHWSADKKLAERLWEWTEEELKPWLA